MPTLRINLSTPCRSSSRISRHDHTLTCPFQAFCEADLVGGETGTCFVKTPPDLNQIITVSLFPQWWSMFHNSRWRSVFFHKLQGKSGSLLPKSLFRQCVN